MTDKKTEALKLARDALEHISSHYMSLPKIGCMALAAVDEAIAEQPAQCQHRIADARNPVVKSGYLCVDCGAIFSAADHAEQPAPVASPHEQQDYLQAQSRIGDKALEIRKKREIARLKFRLSVLEGDA